jgi:hypothetical protein
MVEQVIKDTPEIICEAIEIQFWARKTWEMHQLNPRGLEAIEFL